MPQKQIDPYSEEERDRSSIIIGPIVRIGPMRSFTSDSGQEPGQVNARRLNGERRFVERQGDAFAVPGTWAKSMSKDGDEPANHNAAS